jgi:acyl-CoA dehydrogenase
MMMLLARTTPLDQVKRKTEGLSLFFTDLDRAKIKAATLFDQGLDCGVEANAGKYLAAEAGFEACHTAMLTLGGMGYAQEYHVERYLREVLIPRTAPVSSHMILNYLAEKVLDLPKSY